MSDGLLLPAPKPRDPRRPLYVGLALVATALVVGAYGLGLQHGRSEGVAETDGRCEVAFNELADRGDDALAVTLSAQEWLEEAAEYAATMRAPEVEIMVDAGRP